VEKIDMEALAEFNKVTEWKKDSWSSSEKGFTSNVLDYLDCSRLLHSEE